MFVDYKANEFFKAKRNSTYWNQPYPFLDAVSSQRSPTRSSAGTCLSAAHLT